MLVLIQVAVKGRDIDQGSFPLFMARLKDRTQQKLRLVVVTLQENGERGTGRWSCVVNKSRRASKCRALVVGGRWSSVVLFRVLDVSILYFSRGI
jgi:hypothetical protein